MSAIEGKHDLSIPTGAPPKAASQRSNYCYLFPNLADREESGVFSGTDVLETIQRLKHFEDDFIGLNNDGPAFLMQLPAAYTYFGQFLNHDISAPMGGLLVNVRDEVPLGIIGTADPQGLEKGWRADTTKILTHFVNEQADPMTLGSLYGDSPDDPEVADLYEADGMRFRIARTDANGFIDPNIDPATVFHARGAPDILRRGQKPLIADRRNDGNLILSQLHLAFMLVHNKAVALQDQNLDAATRFANARHLVTRHYHWLILNDFLPNLLSKSVQTKPLAQWQSRLTNAGLDHATKPVPMEFTTAAFRFGHSMVGRSYDFNENFGHGSRLPGSRPEATLEQLFAFTSHGNMDMPVVGPVAGPGAPTLQLPDHWVIDWDRMTLPPRPPEAGRTAAGGAERIDLTLTNDMLNAAGDATVHGHGSIVFRNLLRAFHRRIPFGQVLAQACGVDPGVLAAALAANAGGRDPVFDRQYALMRNYRMDRETPAWLYFLCEARILENGERVGPTASHIIADTIIGLMRAIPSSILNEDGGNWHPKDSALMNRSNKPLDSIRAFLLYSAET